MVKPFWHVWVYVVMIVLVFTVMKYLFPENGMTDWHTFTIIIGFFFGWQARKE